MLKRKQKKTTKKLNEAIQKNEVHVTVSFVLAYRQTLMKREHDVTRSNPSALSCFALSSKRQGRDRFFALLIRFKTDCALNRLRAWISVTVLPEKCHVSLTPTGKSAFFNALSEAGKTLLVVR